METPMFLHFHLSALIWCLKREIEAAVTQCLSMLVDFGQSRKVTLAPVTSQPTYIDIAALPGDCQYGCQFAWALAKVPSATQRNALQVERTNFEVAKFGSRYFNPDWAFDPSESTGFCGAMWRLVLVLLVVFVLAMERITEDCRQI